MLEFYNLRYQNIWSNNTVLENQEDKLILNLDLPNYIEEEYIKNNYLFCTYVWLNKFSNTYKMFTWSVAKYTFKNVNETYIYDYYYKLRTSVTYNAIFKILVEAFTETVQELRI